VKVNLYGSLDSGVGSFEVWPVVGSGVFLNCEALLIMLRWYGR